MERTLDSGKNSVAQRPSPLFSGLPKGAVVPPSLPEDPDWTAESHDSWGFRDSQFVLENESQVRLTGGRYALSGQVLPHLFPWIESTLGVQVKKSDFQASHFPPELSDIQINPKFCEVISQHFSPEQIKSDPLSRLRHSHGHTQDEMYAIKYGNVGKVVDWVLFPKSEEQVRVLVKAAGQHRVCLIPYGGGTNVTHSLQCPQNEERMIVSVDMSLMNRIEWIDKDNFTAKIQAGMKGRDINQILKAYGLTLGHEPDSVEFSTMGGWVATRASGMKKNRYGNIEDLVLDISLVTPDGELKRVNNNPRESVGIDVRDLIFGSEGTLGIVTSVIVKLCQLPQVQKFDSVIFPDFETGFAFLYDLSLSGTLPASVRLMDNLQFQFSHALKPAKKGIAAGKSLLEKWWVTRIKGFDPQKLCALTIVYEGSQAEVAEQLQRVKDLMHKHGGLSAGADNGKRGYDLTFSIAYIRDFAMKYHVMAESFETSVPWTQALEVCRRVKERAYDLHKEHKLPGKPFISCRITQLYRTGVAIYFYYAFYSKGVAQPAHFYARLEHQLRAEILKSGGSLSHHHGVGKIRQSFLPQVLSEYESRLKGHLKQAVDPQNIFGVSNQFLGNPLQ